MAKTPDELLKLVKPWGVEKETKQFMAKYLAQKKHKVQDIDSWIRDRRTAEQFAEQMKGYWAVEDAFSLWLQGNLARKYPSVKVEISGTDQNRKIIQGQSPKGKVTGNLDYKVTFGDDPQPIQVEFQFSATQLDAYDIKKNKVNKADKQKGTILFVFLPLNKFSIMSANYIKRNGQVLVNSRLGGKFTWNIVAEKIPMRPKDYQITKGDLQRGFDRN